MTRQAALLLLLAPAILPAAHPRHAVPIPSPDRTLPTRNQVLSTRDQVLPTHDQVLPARDQMLPTRDQMLPSRDRQGADSTAAQSSPSIPVLPTPQPPTPTRYLPAALVATGCAYIAALLLSIYFGLKQALGLARAQ